MSEWLAKNFYHSTAEHPTAESLRFLLVISPETDEDCGIGYAYSLPVTPAADAREESVNPILVHLCDEQKEDWLPLKGTDETAKDAEPEETSNPSEPANIDEYLHSLYLFGSPKGYEDFFTALQRLGADFDGGNPLNHVDYLSLLDCQSDAEPAFRRLVVTPIFTQTTIIGHLQWAWKYCREEQHEMAAAHVEAAQKCCDNAKVSFADGSSDNGAKPASDNARSPAPMFTAERLTHLEQMTGMLRELIQLRQSRPNTPQRSDVQNFAFGSVPTLRYPYALFSYELAAKLEREARDTLASLPDRRVETITARFQAAIDQYEVCLRHLQEHFLDRPTYHSSYLEAACHLALGRLQNSVERTQVGFRLFPKQASFEVSGHISAAQELVLKMRQQYTRSGDWTEFLNACCLFELGKVEAIAAWKLSRSLNESQDQNAKLTAAAIYNVSLAEQLRGNYREAIEDIGDLGSLDKGYQSGFYEQLLFVINRNLTFSNTSQSAEAAAPSDIQIRLARLTEHISYRKSREEPSARLRATLCAVPGGDEAEQISDLLSLGNPCHLRYYRKATLDLLLVRRLLERWDDYLLAGTQLHTGISGPLAVIKNYVFPKCVWNGLTSRTKWGFYELLTSSLLRRSVITSATNQTITDNKYTLYYLSLLWEYERQIITPLRIAHRCLSVDTDGQWPYISASSSPTLSIDVTEVLPYTTHIIKELRMNRKGGKYELEVYKMSNLYTSEVEYAILDALLYNDGASYARPVFEALNTLQKHCAELVSALLGPCYCDSQVWPNPKSKRQASIDKRIEKEQNARKIAVRLLKDLRNYYSHARGTNSKPEEEKIREAWVYLACTLMICSGKVTARDLGVADIRSPELPDPRSLWFARDLQEKTRKPEEQTRNFSPSQSPAS